MLARYTCPIAVLFCILSTAQFEGAEMPSEGYTDVIAFASDFSGADPTIVKRVQEMAVNPPTDMETIGFYGAEDYSARHRLFLATVNLLDNAGKLHSVEDKYTSDIFSIWQEGGIVNKTTLGSVANAVFGPLIVGEQPPGPINAYRDLVWSQYALATKELEQNIQDYGKVLLSIDATDGDTMFFALVPPEIAGRWRDKALSEQEGYRAGVRSPMWDRLWLNLTYSTRGMVVDDDRKGLPPGTRTRDETIPFAK
ncbi:hypothetical protein [Agrobacterium vaccinii]|uniref:hypothetical protein n=1 Tax=Agrobacterium vaccinii TaxID=2735528 RepID=UPI001E32F09B|nr:hypothetical protein [Agrobacterium vaccinii]UHS58248.1 hypothetical protein HRS00_15055 [Agrobacterium vaccinii]